MQVSDLYSATVDFDFDDNASREAVIVGLALVFDMFSRFAFWLLETFPVLATMG